MDDLLRDLARAAGVSPAWHDAFGRPQTVPADALRALLAALGLPAETLDDMTDSLRRTRESSSPPPLVTAEVGGHARVPMPGASGRMRYRIILDGGGIVEGEAEAEGGAITLPAFDMPGYHMLEAGERQTVIAVAPPRCFSIADATGEDEPRLWGLAVQIYALRRASTGTAPGDGGIGDFSGLSDFARHAASQRASALVLSPVHAPFSADPRHFSPYSPSSRLFLNALHADPAAVFGTDATAAAIAALGQGEARAALEQAAMVDWPQATIAKLALFRRLYEDLPARADLAENFAAFRAAGGIPLEDHARFEAIQTKMLSTDPGKWHWRTWPEGFRDPRGAAVSVFARKNAHDVGFYAFLQWIAARGLANAQATARAAGMPIGLISDLAVGSDGGGSQAWSRPFDMLLGVSIGAPPDLLNSIGQAWGLSAFSPRALVETGFSAFIAMLRATMAHAGGVRIDHIMGLLRLWMVPDSAAPSDGAYLAYPFDDLERLVALESHRHHVIVTGEDLGTVPEGFRERLAKRGILGMQVLWFERDGMRFKPADAYSPDAIAVTGTHDLPTVAGWWRGRDIEWRTPLGLLGENIDEPAARADRDADRDAIWNVLRTDAGGPPPPSEPEPVVDAALAFIGRTPAALVVIPLEDALGLTEQPNLPGTIDDHPNWRRRMVSSAGAVLEGAQVKARLALLDDARHRSGTHAGHQRRHA